MKIKCQKMQRAVWRIKDLPPEYILYLCIQLYRRIILRCINQSTLCFALQDIDPSKLYYLLSVIQSILVGEASLSTEKLQNLSADYRTEIHQLKSWMTKRRVFAEFLHARKTHFSLWEKAAVYPYNNINLQNPCDDI